MENLYISEVQCSEADVARSLLFTISNDIGQIACLYAMMHKLNKVSVWSEAYAKFAGCHCL